MPYKERWSHFGKGEERGVGVTGGHVADFEVFAELVERRADGCVRFTDGIRK